MSDEEMRRYAAQCLIDKCRAETRAEKAEALAIRLRDALVEALGCLRTEWPHDIGTLPRLEQVLYDCYLTGDNADA